MDGRKPISKRTRFEVFKRDKFTCQYCGMAAPYVTLHVDHIVPVAHGGTNDMENLVTSCMSCNLGKGTILVDEDDDESKLVLGKRLRNVDRWNILVADLESKWCPKCEVAFDRGRQ